MLYLNIWLQSLESPILTAFMKLLSDVITEVPLCIAAVIIFWSVNKRTGIAAALTIVSTVTVNTTVKLCFKVLRPYQRMSEIKKLDTTGGYSFPSGHSEQAASIFASVYKTSGREKSVFIAGIVFTLLVMTSRMYLGMHSVLDVLVGALLGVLTAPLVIKLLDWAEGKKRLYALYIIPAVSFLSSAINGFEHDMLVMAALSAGAVTGYIIEGKFIGYNVPSSVGKKVAASAIGLVVILCFKALFIPFDTDSNFVRFAEYLVFGFSITAAAPFIIKKILFHKNDKNDKNGGSRK